MSDSTSVLDLNTSERSRNAIQRSYVGRRVSYDGKLCTIRYIGPVNGTKEPVWFGVEWDDDTRGKHAGSFGGKQYFKCLSPSRTAASFVKPSRKDDGDQDFLQAVRSKYAENNSGTAAGTAEHEEIMISGKVVEEVGFDKIKDQQKRLHELKIVIVDGRRIRLALSAGVSDYKIHETCPSITELDLSRNLFECLSEIPLITSTLSNLRTLKINGNRFREVLPGTEGVKKENDHVASFLSIYNLEMDEVFLPWTTLAGVFVQFANLRTFTASSNRFSSLDWPLQNQNLTSLTLEYNEFSSLWDLNLLRQLTSLQQLHLKGNKISMVDKGNYALTTFHQFGSQLHYVDLSYNAIDSWRFVDDLDYVFPGMRSLRISHNNLYQNYPKKAGATSSIEEVSMLTVARLPNLETLNFSKITRLDRSNAEMFYLSMIGKAMADVEEADEPLVITKYKRYHELCEKYGAPAVVRQEPGTINPNFLEARLIIITFYMPPNTLQSQPEKIVKEFEVPQSFDIYRVKSLVGRLFGLDSLDTLPLALIWETGEWDPVAGYEEEDDSEDEDGEVEQLAVRLGKTAPKQKGKWMKREVEIETSTRKVGNCIDGLEATVRVDRCPGT